MFSSNTSQTSGGYEIQRSLRFNSADSAYLNRTPASASNRKTWTYSTWVKRVSSGTTQHLLRTNATPITLLRFEAGDQLYFYSVGVSAELRTTAVYRDFSAWYHVVWVVDTTQATASDRLKLYVNGVQVTSFSTATYPSQNTDLGINTASAHAIGATTTPDEFSNQYLTEINFIDGQALTPSSFGAFDAQTGVWGPTPYAGSYGTNGFYLNFSDNSNTTAATLGKDYSGNSNNWTPNNFSVSAGAGNDSLVDVPTNWGTDTGVGGSVRGNYATWNSILQTNDAANTYANGNLEVSATSSNWANGTISTNSGSYYFELTPTVGAAGLYLGINNTKTDVRVTAYSGGIEASPGGGSNQTGLASWSNGDIIGVAVNGVSKTVQFYRNGSTYGSQVTYTTALDLFPFARNAIVSSSTTIINAGQRPFAYTAPSGFKALNTQNLPTPTIGATTATQAGKFFNPVLYTGNASTNNITGVGFETDFVWFKCRNVGFANVLMDRVRGITNSRLFSNSTDAESTSTTYINSTNSDGFQLAVGDNGANGSGQTYVAWNWKANGAGVTNTAGSITSTVSANTTSGFSVVTYTGTGANATVGHGLGAAPKFIIIKGRSGTTGWPVYSESVGNTRFGYLNTNGFFDVNNTAWNNTSPTSSVFTIGTGGLMNTAAATYVAYCFSEVPGYSRFGSYTGNGSTDGVFVFCGFRPEFVLMKLTSGDNDWVIMDAARNPANVANATLYPNGTYSEDAAVSIDFTSNGFKLRTTNPATNGSGNSYIFAAFAEAPQKFALAR